MSKSANERTFQGELYRIIHTILAANPDNQLLATIFSASLIGKPNKAIVQTSLDNFKLQNYANLVPILQAFVDENYYASKKSLFHVQYWLVLLTKPRQLFIQKPSPKIFPTPNLLRLKVRHIY